MTCSNQINICRSLFLQFQENPGEAIPGKNPHTGCANLRTAHNAVILAENTAQTTAAEENSTGTTASGNAGFLSKMQRCPGGPELSVLTAEAQVSRSAVSVAFAWTKRTVLHEIIQFFRSHFHFQISRLISAKNSA